MQITLNSTFFVFKCKDCCLGPLSYSADKVFPPLDCDDGFPLAALNSDLLTVVLTFSLEILTIRHFVGNFRDNTS